MCACAYDEQIELISKAIKDGKPYDEMKLLTAEERKLYESGDLLF